MCALLILELHVVVMFLGIEDPFKKIVPPLIIVFSQHLKIQHFHRNGEKKMGSLVMGGAPCVVFDGRWLEALTVPMAWYQ